MNTLKTILILLLLQLFINCGSKEIEKPKDLLNYTLIEDKISESPAKTQILTDIIVDINDSITKQRLEELLNYLYNERINRTGFEYRENPNCIAIYAYMSKERAESGAGQWIAMVAKMPMDTESKISFNDAGLNSVNEKEEVKWNLPFNTRQEIWDKIIFAERDSQTEADKVHPFAAGMTKEDLTNNGKLANRLKKQKEIEIINLYKIDEKTLDSISNEGISNDWAFPKKH